MYPALIEATTRGYVVVIEVLLDAGANIESSWGDHGTALMVACSGGRLSVAQTLGSCGAKVSYTAADDTSFSALDQAKRHPDIAKWLGSAVGLQACSDSIEVYQELTKEPD